MSTTTRSGPLSRPQLALFGRIIAGQVPIGDPSVNQRTLVSLCRRRIVARNGYTLRGPSAPDGRGLWGASYPDGYTLAACRGLLPTGGEQR